jgi:alanine dehydrogenase
MLIGVPKEIKTHEYRVGVTPASAREFVARNHEVLVEAGAGAGINVSDEQYIAAGAKIGSCGEVFAKAKLIIKVKEPQPSEWKRLSEGQILFAYLHLAADPKQAEGLIKSGCTAVAYETVTDDDGRLPLLAPMSEVAGRLSIEAAGAALRKHSGGRGVLMGGVPGVRPAKVVILGGGVVGTHAARMAVGLSADVVLLDRSIKRLRELDEMFSGVAKTRFSSLEAVESEIADADVVIGAVLVPGAAAPKLISRKMLKSMKAGAVLVDVAIDQGGCFETSKATTHDNPIYEVDGILHYCVANMPGSVPLTSSHALNNATLPYALSIAEQDVAVFKNNRHLANGLTVHRGRLTNSAVAAGLSLPHTEVEEIFGALGVGMP